MVSAAFVYQLGSVNTAVGNPAWAHQDAMERPTAEVAPRADWTVVLPLSAAQLETQPQACSKVSSAKVADGAHFIGAAEQDLHAQVQFDSAVRARGADDAT